MASHQLDEEAIFHVARQIPNPEARATYLDQVCEGAFGLRGRVEELLKVHDDEQEFLKSSPKPTPTVDQPPITERPGTAIGRYHLREQIGEGGMGIVFVAEQRRPIQRKVALKVIKPGMDSKAVIARFDVERQALAMMDHPNIAKVLDAGTTESGHPYFVMELVRGVPITEYCDDNKLSITERLELFTQVCQAIQHAHQKGIIHRDIKPSNVLVTLHDDKPVIKVIDFGVAKAISQRLTEQTVYTGFAQAIGTPLYMSPEQAGASGLDIDTRTDIYSLGVLLYELLTGTTPFDKQQFDKAAYEEVRRIIREQEPAKPSNRISTLGATLRSVSAQRRIDPQKLCRFVRGDLDWIVMKALEKDRTRRYETAVGFAADLRRFLADELVEARRPSTVYRFTKFIRRNRLVVTATTLVVLSLLLGIVTTTWMAKVAWLRLEQLAAASYQEAVTAALAGDTEEANKALRVARQASLSPDKVAIVHGLIALSDGNYEEAIDHAESSLATETADDIQASIGASALLAAACLCSGDDERWEHEISVLRGISPMNDTDRILKAFAIATADPKAAEAILEETPRIGKSPVGLYVRSVTGYLQGTDTQNPKQLDRAIQDFDYVRYFFGDTQGVVGYEVAALAAAIQLAKRDERVADVDRYMKHGDNLADILEANSNIPATDYDRWLYYQATGDNEKAWSAISRVGQYSNSYCLFLAASCLGRFDGTITWDEFNNVLKCEDKSSPWVRIAQAHLVRDLPDGESEVHRLVDDLVTHRAPLICRHAVAALCLVDGVDTIRDHARRALDSADKVYAKDDIFNGGECLKYLACEIPEEQFIADATAHGYSLANVYFNIAMLRLADGDAKKAREAFEKCVATNAIGSFDYELGRGYLARMSRDREWPQWLKANRSSD